MEEAVSGQDPATDPVLAKQRADAEKAEADAKKAKAEAEQAQAAAETAKAGTAKAQAEAAKAEAEAEKAKTEAAKAKKEVDDSIESDPDVAAARKASRVAELAKSTAEAEASAAKAGVPETPTLASIADPADKSAKVGDTGGAATAKLTAVHALQLVGEGIGDEIVAELIDYRRPTSPQIRQRERSVLDRLFARRSGPEPTPAELTSTMKSEAAQHRIWMMESAGTATGDLLRLELARRLEGFVELFSAVPATTKPDEGRPTPVQGKGLEDVAAAAAGATAVAAGGPPAVAAVAALKIGTDVIKFGVELVSALRGRYALFGRDIDLNRTALLAGVAGRVAQSGIKVNWKRYAPVDQSALMDLFGKAMAARETYAATVLIEPVPPDDATKKAAFERAKKLVDAFDAFAVEITKPGASGFSPLVESAATEFFEPPTDASEHDYLLYVDISEKGADGMAGYGVWKGSTAAFLGFTQAYYVLVRRDGSVVLSGSITDDLTAQLHLDTAILELPAPSGQSRS